MHIVLKCLELYWMIHITSLYDLSVAPRITLFRRSAHPRDCSRPLRSLELRATERSEQRSRVKAKGRMRTLGLG